MLRPSHTTSNLATLEARITGPDLFLGVEFFPLFAQVWQRGGIPFFPAGSNYLGNEVLRPIRDAGTDGATLELPNGFERIYTSAEGTVILTNSPAFDPIQEFPLETWDEATLRR